jgi:hypothetical protein
MRAYTCPECGAATEWSFKACGECGHSESATPVRRFQVVQCLRCGHVWDEEDPKAEVCACIETHGNRTVEVISEGATNVPSRTVV